MTQIGEGQGTPGSWPEVLTFGAASLGEILAERYQLEEHVANDTLGRQLWKGIDVVLRRPVAVVLRQPGGESAGEMLAAAVAASRIVHPHLVGVYDAIDEGDRAYVVREWVDGSSLRDLVSDGPFDPDRAVMVVAAITDAVAAIHATGMAHGNIHPGTVLVAADGRVVLTDARADESATPDADIRAIGGLLYCALTAYWPHAEAGPAAVPDGVRDAAGNLASPRQVRAGVPSFLDDLTVDLLNPDLARPRADVLLAELSRFEQEQGGGHGLFQGSSSQSLGFDSLGGGPAEAPEQSRPVTRKIAIGVVSLLLIASLGVFGAVKALSSGGNGSPSGGSGSGTVPQRSVAAGQPVQQRLTANQVHIVDGAKKGCAPSLCDRADVKDAEKTVDGSISTGWLTDSYRDTADFGGLKTGMGVLIDLGEEKRVTHAQVQLSASGASIELRGGTSDPGRGLEADAAVLRDYQRIGDARPDSPGPNVVLAGAPDKPVRYLLLWITKLPPNGTDGYQIGIQEISVFAQ